MKFFNPETGEIRFADGLSLRGGINVRQIDSHLRHTGGPEAVYCLPPLAVEGGSLAAVCMADADGLHAVRLTVASVTGRQQVPGERQRAFLFERFQLSDPCPDTLQNVSIRAPFGRLTLYTDPVTGQAGALVEYR
ncbi:MAG: hypothetical protein J6K73_05600 [Clostridia bacterium]|nr:hypothetical protein [Clostridia bacterium]